jgi:hypothetical protein
MFGKIGSNTSNVWKKSAQEAPTFGKIDGQTSKHWKFSDTT